MADPTQPEQSTSTRSFAARAERSLKDADRTLKKGPELAPQEQAMAHVERAKTLALLDLAEAIRENGKG